MPNKKIYFILVVVASIWLSHCTPEEEILDASPGMGLTFSEDTVWFDTVFTQMQTVTKRLKVYNPNPKTITINTRIAGQPAGPFSIIVNGRRPGSVNNLEIRGKDSIYVLVSAKIDPNNQNNPYLVEDSLLFEVNGNTSSQHINMVAYGQNAHYLRGQLVCDTTFTADKPWILLPGTDTINNLVYPNAGVIVGQGCTLTIDPGARVHLYNGTNIYVNGTLRAIGTQNKRIEIKQTRLQESYNNIPGQWGAMVFFNSSQNNNIAYCEIANGTVIQVGNPETTTPIALTIENSTIRHMSAYGLYAFNSQITSINSVYIDCGSALVAGLAGGTYGFYHNTMAYSLTKGFRRDNAAVNFTDFFETETEVVTNPLQIQLINNIISGPNEVELAVGAADTANIDDFTLANNIITDAKSEDVAGNMYISRVYNGFVKPSEYNFKLDSTATAINKGIEILANGQRLIPIDHNNQIRNDTVDIGAFEYLK